MTAAELQELLIKPYNRAKWLALIRDVLPSAQPYPITSMCLAVMEIP